MATLVSIVIPCFNEEKNVPLMHAALKAVFARLDGRYSCEMLFINDGSKDKTWASIEAAAAADPRVKGICFSRNFGNQYAFEAGLRNASGDIIVTMDGDLQHPPEAIPELLFQYEQGHDIVMTARVRYGNEPRFKKATSYLFYRIFNLIADLPIEPASMDFMLLSRRVVEVLNTTDEAERFYRGLVQWLGFSRTTVPVTPHNRENGTTSMTMKRLLSLTWTAITSFSTLPMKGIVMLGALVMAGSWALLLVMAFARFGLGSEYFSQLSFLVVFIISSNGLMLTAIGLVAMYLLRIHKEVQGRPNYIVSGAEGVPDIPVARPLRESPDRPFSDTAPAFGAPALSANR